MSYNPYLGEEPPADSYASMNVDDEYEGGEWIDGEFYYEKRKRERPNRATEQGGGHLRSVGGGRGRRRGEREDGRRKQSKRRDEEMISDDDEEAGGGGGGRDCWQQTRAWGWGPPRPSGRRSSMAGGKQASEGSSLLTRTMKFVASSTSTLQHTDRRQTIQPPQQPLLLSRSDSSSCLPLHRFLPPLPQSSRLLASLMRRQPPSHSNVAVLLNKPKSTVRNSPTLLSVTHLFHTIHLTITTPPPPASLPASLQSMPTMPPSHSTRRPYCR